MIREVSNSFRTQQATPQGDRGGKFHKRSAGRAGADLSAARSRYQETAFVFVFSPSHAGDLDRTGEEGSISLIPITEVFKIVLTTFTAFPSHVKKQHVVRNTEKLALLDPPFFSKRVHMLQNETGDTFSIPF